MFRNALFVSILVGFAIFMVIILIASVQYNINNNRMRSGRKNPEDWLFHNFSLRLYSALFGWADEDTVAMKIGINIERYYKSCALTKTRPDVKKLIMNHVYGFCLLILCCVLSFLFGILFLAFGAAAFLYLVFYEQKRLDSIADGMRTQVANELPRFLDLLQTELQVGLPIETAIDVLSSKMDTLLSTEFKTAMTEMELGVSDWQKALERVAAKYEIETLSEFVMDTSTAYRKGVSIADAVTRKAREIKESHLLTVKEKAGKTTNTILVPMVIFQFIPMIAFILLPALLQVSAGLY